MQKLPDEILDLANKRNELRRKKDFKRADEIRKQIESKGFTITDSSEGQKLELKSQTIKEPQNNKKDHALLAIFGSGEMSPAGRRVHEYLIQDLSPPVKIALLETPTGFEVNPHYWYDKLSEMLTVGLQNFKPIITRVPALRRDGPNNTNDPETLKPLLESDYVHTGAGSPTYAAKHLSNSLALKYLSDFVKNYGRISFASATAIAFGKYLLPVYEIYKAGEDLHWKEGLDFFQQWDLNLSIIPHWDNTEGGKEIDTSRCYMGKARFEKLLKLLPGPTTILGIDEQTACIFDLSKKEVSVMGNGTTTILKGSSKKIIQRNSKFSFSP